METALPILVQLLPLYVIIALGYVGTRLFQFDGRALAQIAIYLITPMVVLGFTAQMHFTPDSLLLPIIAFACGIIITLGAYNLHRSFGFKDAHGNLSAMGIGGGNTGYFGLPLFVILFGADNVGVYVLGVLGYTFTEILAGYYVISRGRFSVRESLLRVVRMPAIYAGIIGLIWSIAGLPMPKHMITMFDWFRGAYTVVGMLIIGCTLGKMHKLEFDWKFLGITILGRHLIWSALFLPLAIFWTDLALPVRQSFLVMSLVPLAANFVAYANETDIHPEKAATAVILSTILSAVIIALVAPLLHLL